MNKGFIFFCCACAILLFTLINLSIGPIVTGTVNRYDKDWGLLNTVKAKDDYDDAKDNPLCNDDCLKYGTKWILNELTRKKGMHDMEYTSFIFDIVIGFTCGLLGLLHYFGLKPDFVKITGLIGIVCGIVGFILTFVYVIFNGLVYTTVDTGIVKRNGDGAYAERINSATGNTFKCIYFDKPLNSHAVHAKISDLIKKQYNYNKDLYKSVDPSCISDNYIDYCEIGETFPGPSTCQYIYAEHEYDIVNKDLSNRFLTTLILSLFVCLANIGLVLFGFLLFKSPEDGFAIKFDTTKN